MKIENFTSLLLINANLVTLLGNIMRITRVIVVFVSVSQRSSATDSDDGEALPEGTDSNGSS